MLDQVNVLAMLAFWYEDANSSSRVSSVFNDSCSITRIREVPGDYLEGEYSMGEAV